MVGLDLGGESNDVEDPLYAEPSDMYRKSPSIASRASSASLSPRSSRMLYASVATARLPVFKPPFAVTSFDRQVSKRNYFAIDNSTTRRVSKLTTKSMTGNSAASTESDFEI